MDVAVASACPPRLRRSNTYSPSAPVAPRVESAAWDDLAAPTSVSEILFYSGQRKLPVVYDSDGDGQENNQCESNNNEPTDTDIETDDSQPATPPDSYTAPPMRRKITLFDAPIAAAKRVSLRRNSADARSLMSTSPTSTSISKTLENISSLTTSQLSSAQKRGCFHYIKRRHSIAMAFASLGDENNNNNNRFDDALGNDNLGSHWEYVKAKHGIEIFKSKRSRCEIRGVTRVNSSVKNVMALLAAGETTESFSHAQNILLGRDQVLEARVLASCVPSSTSQYFHCGLKYMAMKNPFGLHPLDLVFLDYTDITTTPDNKLIGYRIVESIRVPEFRSVNKYIRASIRCEVYIVRETDVAGVVEVTFASHLDPKSKYSASKRHTWLDQVAVRLSNLRSYAEKASFSHRLVLEKGMLVKGDACHHCSVCETTFSFLRKRHNCRLCGQVACGRCSRKLPVFVGTETTRVRVCLGCMIEARHRPDELGRLEILQGRRNSIGNATYIAYDEGENVNDNEQGI